MTFHCHSSGAWRHVTSLARSLVLAITVAAGGASAAEAPKKSFDIPAGAAEQTLKKFSEQSRMEVLVPTTTVKDIHTLPVRGEMTSREALERMLSGTGLIALPDEKKGIVTVRRETPVTDSGTNGAHTPPITTSDRPANSDSRAGTGTIAGRVFNGSTGAALAKVRVSVVGTSLETTTDEGGSFQLGGLPAGDTQLRVSYLGLLSQTATVKVAGGGSIQMDFELVRTEQEGTRKAGEIVRLREFNVVEEREMSAQDVAVNEQRNAPNIKNVVAMGEFGDRGSENIGEFLRFLPGVSILNSGEEADTISLRGIPASNTGIMMDGAQIATGGDNTRALSLRAIPMANISRVEVTKVPTPDAPASGLGGTINLISASAFDKRKPEFSYQVYGMFNNTDGITFDGGRRWQLKEVTSKYNQPSVDVRYTHPVTKDFSLTVSAARTWRINPLKNTEEATWDLVRYVQTAINLAQVTQTVTTVSGQMGADWRISPKDTLSASFHRREYERPTTRSNLNVAFGAGASGSPTFTQGAATGVGSVSQGANWRVDLLDTSQFNVKYRHQEATWRLDAAAAWSESVGVQEDIVRGFFANSTATIANLVIRGDDIPTSRSEGISPRQITARDRQGNPVDIFAGENYSLSLGNSNAFKRKGTIKHGRIDLTREFDGRVPVTLKTGAAVNQDQRDARTFAQSWNFLPNGASDVTSRLAGRFPVFDESFLANPPNFQHLPVPYRSVSHKKFYELYQQRPEWFVLDQPLQHQSMVNGSREYTETISAGYLRADVRFFSRRLWVATGARFEQTDGKGRGPLNDSNAQYQRDANGNFIRNAAGQRVLITTDPLALRKLLFKERGARSETDYSGIYPSLNSSFDLTEQLVVRAAYARTIGRPEMSFITPGSTISDPDIANPTITVNNPGLRPWTANNFDLSIESYNFKDGFGSIGVFHKEIKDFFGTVRSPATPELLAAYGMDFDPSLASYSVATRTNEGDTKVTGFEFGYRQSLTFLPHWARGLQVFFTATTLKIKGSKSTDLEGFNPETFSGGINFIRPRFYLKATWSLQSETPLALIAPSASIPANTRDHRGSIEKPQVGISAQYSFSRRLSVYFAMSDVTKLNTGVTRARYAPETPDFARSRGWENNGYYTTIGVKGAF